MDQKTQLELFSHAVTLLGGNTATARELGMNERSVRFILDGTRRPHAGILEDMAKALIRRADECREVERKLSPAFAANLTEAQEKPPLHDGKQRLGMRTKRLTPDQVAHYERALGLKD